MTVTDTLSPLAPETGKGNLIPQDCWYIFSLKGLCEEKWKDNKFKKYILSNFASQISSCINSFYLSKCFYLTLF